jgi:uncharacterized protein (TIGR03000 family)
MFRNTFSFVGALLLAGAALLAMPGPSQAQRGGRGGGVHVGGGARFGGVRYGSYGGGYHQGYSGYRSYNHSYSPYRRYYNYGHKYRFGYGYPYYDSYGLYPDYGSYYGSYPDSSSYPDSDYDAYPYYDSILYTPPASSSGPSGPSADIGQPVVSSTPSDTTAHVTVKVPADAEVWLEGKKTTSTGSVREFQSPPLEAGYEYTYTLRARWLQNGKEITQTQEVGVSAGAHVNVDFPVASGTAKPASAIEER